MNTIISEEKFNEIYLKYSKELFNISYGYTRNISDSEDILQNVFMKYLKKGIIFNTDEETKYWLIRVTINQSIDFVRSYYKKSVIIADDIVQLKSNAETEKVDYGKFIALLPEKYKKVLILFYYDNLSCYEISKILSVSENNIYKLLERGRKKLKNIMGEKKNG